MGYTCDICNIILVSKQKYENHVKSKKHIEIYNVSEKYQQKLQELENINKVLMNENNDLKHKNEMLNMELSNLKATSSKFEKIVEKAALKSTSVTTNNINNTTNLLQYLSNEPIDFSSISEQMTKLGPFRAKKGEKIFNEQIRKTILQDTNGNDKVVCTDIARGNFAYKDDKTDELVYDPLLEKLREQLRNGAKEAEILQELNDMLELKYGNDPDNVNMRLAEFNRARKNLNFTDKFARYIARKTYKKVRPKIKFID